MNRKFRSQSVRGTGIAACLVAAALSSCAYPNQFRNVRASHPHALLTADPGEHWRDRGPNIFLINSQPTSFWRGKERFLIPPGGTILRVIADQPPYGYAPVRFTAEAGRQYHLRYADSRSFVSLYDVTDSSAPSLITKSAREAEASRETATSHQGRASDADNEPKLMPDP